MIFSKENSLRWRVNNLIKKNHPQLFTNNLTSIIRIIKDKISYSTAWVYVVGVITVVFMCGLLIDISIIDIIPIKLDTAQKIIDQRASNIATIMSITLVVVGFLMNNIAVKESFSYQLLFRRSYFYPIIYLVLSVIAYFFIASIIRDWISEFHFIRLVLIGTYLAIFILFVIGYLFKSIIQFTNSEKIVSLLHDEVIYEAVNNLKEGLFREYSSDLYKKIMLDAGCKEYDLSEALGNIKFDSSTSFQYNDSNSYESKDTLIGEDKVLHDIDLKQVLEFVYAKKENSRILFKGLTLGNAIAIKNEDYVWVKGVENSPEEKNRLRKVFVLRKVPDFLTKEVSSPREYLDQKLEEWSSDNKSKRLDQLLKTYRELYELELNNIKSLDNA